MQGTLLMGAIVPNKMKCLFDGCSVPRGLGWIMNAKQARSACMIHDFDYYILGIMYGSNSDDLRFQELLMQADFRLKLNRKMIARRGFKTIYGMFYFKGVRLGGSYCIKDFEDLPQPPDMETLDAIFLIIDNEYKMTRRAEIAYDEWQRRISR